MSATDNPTVPTIAFIGAGNMAGAIIRGLVQSAYPAECLRASAPSRKNLQLLRAEFSLPVHQDNRAAAAGADVLVLGVKPQVMQGVCEELQESVSDNTLVLSLAAGITCASLEQWLGRSLPVVRCMSNTPAQIGVGASGLFANASTSTTQKDIAERIMTSIGVARWVDQENTIDSVTALAGSGPAYFFLFIEAMIEAAVAQGMNAEDAELLALQTARGAAQLAAESGENVVDLRARVTSPNGTTEQAIKSFEADGLRTTVKNAMNACLKRAQELASQ